jgi:hypothetical protein
MRRSGKGEGKSGPPIRLVNVERRRYAEDQQAEADARSAAESIARRTLGIACGGHPRREALALVMVQENAGRTLRALCTDCLLWYVDQLEKRR